MDYGNIVKLEFDKGDGTMIFPTSDITKKFSLNDFKEQTTSLGSIPTTFDAATCKCDNFVMEAHYNVFFKETYDTLAQKSSNSQADAAVDAGRLANQFLIDKVTVDLVYGSIDGCKPHTFSLKTSLNFY